ncbi:MAG: hypothetical protein ACLTW9_20830 [Enterocloster sp.]
MKQYICIDIGGTEIKHGMHGRKRNCSWPRTRRPPRPSKAVHALLEKVVPGLSAEYLKVLESRWNLRVHGRHGGCGEGEIFYAAPLIPDYAGTKDQGQHGGRVRPSVLKWRMT